MDFLTNNMETVLIILLVLVILKLLYDNRESFTPGKSNVLKQCDYNDKNLGGHCKEVRDGCIKLTNDEKIMKSKLRSNCDLKKDANTARETISQKRDCVTDVERLIRASYAKTELCSQIKNLPDNIKLSKDEQLNSLSLSDVKAFDKNGIFSDVTF
jgi:hypothetical protein